MCGADAEIFYVAGKTRLLSPLAGRLPILVGSVVAVDGAVAVVATVVVDVVVDGVSYPFPLFRQPVLTSAINRNSTARI